jgi:hypothetical protein
VPACHRKDQLLPLLLTLKVLFRTKKAPVVRVEDCETWVTLAELNTFVLRRKTARFLKKEKSIKLYM